MVIEGEEKGWLEVCVCVLVWFVRRCENLGPKMANLRSVKNVWMHLRSSRDKKGSSGVRGLLLGLLIPWPSHPFRACLRSDSLALCVDDSAPPADLICYVFLLPRRPLHLNHHCPRAGPSLPFFFFFFSKESVKGTFQAGLMSLDRMNVGGKSSNEETLDSKVQF